MRWNKNHIHDKNLNNLYIYVREIFEISSSYEHLRIFNYMYL